MDEFMDFLNTLSNGNVHIVRGNAEEMPLELLAQILYMNGLPEEEANEVISQIKKDRETKKTESESADRCESEDDVVAGVIKNIAKKYNYNIDGVCVKDGHLIYVESIVYADTEYRFAPFIVCIEGSFFVEPKAIRPITPSEIDTYVSLLLQAKSLCEILNGFSEK